MSEWWSAFLWGAGTMAVAELVLAVAVFLVLRQLNKKAAAEAASRILTRLEKPY